MEIVAAAEGSEESASGETWGGNKDDKIAREVLKDSEMVKQKRRIKGEKTRGVDGGAAK